MSLKLLIQDIWAIARAKKACNHERSFLVASRLRHIVCVPALDWLRILGKHVEEQLAMVQADTDVAQAVDEALWARCFGRAVALATQCGARLRLFRAPVIQRVLLHCHMWSPEVGLCSTSSRLALPRLPPPQLRCSGANVATGAPAVSSSFGKIMRVLAATRVLNTR